MSDQPSVLDLRAYVQRDASMRAFGLYLNAPNRFKDTISIATSITFEDIPQAEAYGRDAPLLYLPEAAAQTLMDDLWHAGVRPTTAKRDNDPIEAKDAHIKFAENVATRLLEKVLA